MLTACDGEAALAALRGAAVSLIISDLVPFSLRALLVIVRAHTPRG